MPESRQPDPLMAVRVCMSNRWVEVNFYRWEVGKRFARSIELAERRGWVKDVGGRNRGIRYFEATDAGRKAVQDASK